MTPSQSHRPQAGRTKRKRVKIRPIQPSGYVNTVNFQPYFPPQSQINFQPTTFHRGIPQTFPYSYPIPPPHYVQNMSYVSDDTESDSTDSETESADDGDTIVEMNNYQPLPMYSATLAQSQLQTSQKRSRVAVSPRRKAKRKSASASSIFKGVSWHKRDKCYMARVWLNNSSKHIGSFQEEMKAALAVDERLEALGKDKSFMNFTSKLERDIALTILKNQEVKPPPPGSVSIEEQQEKGVDRNGYTNTLIPALKKLIAAEQERKRRAELAEKQNANSERDEPSTNSTESARWTEFVQVVNTQNGSSEQH